MKKLFFFIFQAAKAQNNFSEVLMKSSCSPGIIFHELAGIFITEWGIFFSLIFRPEIHRRISHRVVVIMKWAKNDGGGGEEMMKK